MKKIILFIILSFTFTGCSPGLLERKLVLPQEVENTLPNPTEIIQDKIRQNNLNLQVKSSYSNQELLDLYQSLNAFDSSKAFHLLNLLAEKVPTESQKIENSDYADLIATEGQKLASENIVQLLPQIEKSELAIYTWLSTHPSEQTLGDTPAGEVFEKMFTYFNQLYRAIPTMGLIPPVESAFLVELENKIKHSRQTVDESLKKGLSATSLTELIQVTNRGLLAEKMLIDEESKKSLQSGEKLGLLLDKMNDPQSSLSVLVQVWRMLSPDDRLNQFKIQNERLFKYLNSMDEDELDCLSETDCLVPTKVIAKKLFIFPELEKYGISKLKQELNQKSIIKAREQIRLAIIDSVNHLPLKIQNEVSKSFKEKKQFLVLLQNDFKSEFKKRLKAWGSQKLAGGQFQVPRAFNTQTKFIGEKVIFQVVVESESEVNIDHSHAAMNLIQTAQFTDALSSSQKLPFLVTGINQIAKDYRASADEFQSTTHFLSRIKFKSQNAKLYRDWQSSPFADLASAHTMKELFPEIDADEFKQSLFPQDAFMAMSLYHLSELLDRLTLEKTPLYMVSLKDQIIPANEYIKGSSEITALSGITENFDPTPDSWTRSNDITESLLSLSNFIELLDKVELTKNKYLLLPYNNQEIPLQKIQNGLPQLKKLIMVQANYLAKKMTLPSGMIGQKRNYTKELQGLAPYLLQLKAIQAYLSTAQITGMKIYIWEAIALYRSLKKNFYDLRYQVWKDPLNESPELFELSQTIAVFTQLAPYLDAAERKELEWILDPWIKVLQDIQFEVK